MLDFAETIVDCQLVDPGFTSPLFTWERESTGLRQRLDHILIGEFWTSVFPSTRVKHLARVCLDHAPLLVCCQLSIIIPRSPLGFRIYGFGTTNSLMMSSLFGEIPLVSMECSIFNSNCHVLRSTSGSGTVKPLGMYMTEPSKFGMMYCRHKFLLILPPPLLLVLTYIRALQSMFLTLAWRRTSGDRKRLFAGLPRVKET